MSCFKSSDHNYLKVLSVPLVHPLPAVDCLPGVCHPHGQHQGGAAPRAQHPPRLLGQGHSWDFAACLTLEGNVTFNPTRMSAVQECWF